MSLKTSYSLLAPVYDILVSGGSQSLRQQSLAELNAFDLADAPILIDGIGSGLDIPFLPIGPSYTGVDITPNMLKRAQARMTTQQIRLEEGDAMSLPYADNQFAVVIMHLILAVVPKPERALQEAERVLQPGGHILIIDKFLKPGQTALIRRLINPLISKIATRTNVVFEDVLAQCPSLYTVKDIPSLANGWFRQIVLRRKES